MTEPHSTLSSLWLPGRPVPFARPGQRPDGRRYTPRRYQEWKEAAAWQIRTATTIQPHDGPLRIRIIIYSDGVHIGLDPSDRLRPKGIRGDLDNYVKAVLDAAQEGRAMKDDRQIVGISARFQRRGDG